MTCDVQMFAIIKNADAVKRDVLAIAYAKAWLLRGGPLSEKIYAAVNAAQDSQDSDLADAANAIADLAGVRVHEQLLAAL
jgi:hypothetical protein